MKIKQLINNAGIFPAGNVAEDFEVAGVACDSKMVSDNFIFVAIKGEKFDGHQFIREAIDRGARLIVYSAEELRRNRREGLNLLYDEKSPIFIKVKDTKKALAKLAAEFFAHPSEKIKVTGITGTNGKTTVTYLIEAILKESGSSPAVIGTIDYRFGNKIITAKNTTPGVLELESLFSKMLKEGVTDCAMEVSSHALEQGRTDGINFSSAIFTNLTQDHLDYHKTLENYFKSKARLFKNISPESFVVLNNDDQYCRRLKKITRAKIITYGIENNAQVMARDIEISQNGTKFSLVFSGVHPVRDKAPKVPDTDGCLRQPVSNGVRAHISTRLIGRHNIYNILAVSAWAFESGISLVKIKSALKKFPAVPGRLQRIASKKNIAVFVDYAHTDDALTNVIKSLRQLSKNKIIVVFGCGGERDKSKRPKMGRVVSELADIAIITNDNPRSEDPLKIIAEIKKGIKRNNYYVIPDRLKAIKKGLSLAKTGDTVLVAGKGHENYQILKNRTIAFDDRKIIKACLKSANY